MLTASKTDLFRRFDAAELSLCMSCNRWSNHNSIRHLFAMISRLGNGVFWYVLILSLPLIYGTTGMWLCLQFSITGCIGVLLYKSIKQRWVRERPYISHLGIRAGTAPLDRCSFPSGHTLHAVCFAILFSVNLPELACVVIPFAILVALSRLILGMHYPTDVIVGALLGTTLAYLSISLATLSA
ncbi:MAG: phosphatase PAP2 family protein [Steroidobacteraceae bacterium]